MRRITGYHYGWPCHPKRDKWLKIKAISVAMVGYVLAQSRTENPRVGSSILSLATIFPNRNFWYALAIGTADNRHNSVAGSTLSLIANPAWVLLRWWRANVKKCYKLQLVVVLSWTFLINSTLRSLNAGFEGLSMMSALVARQLTFQKYLWARKEEYVELRDHA